MRKRTYLLIFSALCLGALSTQLWHNGESISKGTWPFRDFGVRFSEMPLSQGFDEEYYFHPLVWHESIILDLRFTSDKSVSFFQKNLKVPVEYSTGFGDPRVMKPRMNEDRERINRMGKGFRSEDDEWSCYSYPKSKTDRTKRSSQPPERIKSKLFGCYIIIDNPRSTITVKMSALPQSNDSGIKVRFEAVSGWK